MTVSYVYQAQKIKLGCSGLELLWGLGLSSGEGKALFQCCVGNWCYLGICVTLAKPRATKAILAHRLCPQNIF